ncbi:hypothetical protein FRC06_006397 [Ceratobasidium sp. 370]|nr:hypothetical protein FRC06_006397 [Ceratobasidium sp. 370]
MDFITTRRNSAYCAVCTDTFGDPMLLDRKSVKRHEVTKSHCCNVEISDSTHRTTANSSTRRERDISTNQVNSHLDDKVFCPSLSLSSHELEAEFHDFAHGSAVPQDSDALGDVPESKSEYDSRPDFDPSSIDDLFVQSLKDTDADGVEVPADSEDGSASDDDDWETESDCDPCEIPRQHQSAAHYVPYSPTSDSEWRPFPGKAWCLADAICNSRRVHFGRRHIEIMLEFVRQTQGETIPMYYALRKFQKSLKSRVGDPSKRYVSPFGTVYYVNKISEGLKQGFMSFAGNE